MFGSQCVLCVNARMNEGARFVLLFIGDSLFFLKYILHWGLAVSSVVPGPVYQQPGILRKLTRNGRIFGLTPDLPRQNLHATSSPED